MKVTNTLPHKDLRAILIEWCQKNKCWINFDNIASEVIFKAGWFKGIHPHIFNRNDFKQFLTEGDNDLDSKIQIYPRKIWQNNSDNQSRTLTEAIVLDGDITQRERILTKMFQMQWTGPYKNVKFIPFKLTTSFTIDHQQRAMQMHNIYMQNIKNKLFKVNNAHHSCNHPKLNITMNIKTWMQTLLSNDSQLFIHIEIINDELLNLIYLRFKEPAVNTAIANIFNLVSSEFNKNMALEALGPEQVYINTMTIHNLEEAYASECAKSLLPSNQAPTQNAPPLQKIKPSYGEALLNAKPNAKPTRPRQVNPQCHNITTSQLNSNHTTHPTTPPFTPPAHTFPPTSPPKIPPKPTPPPTTSPQTPPAKLHKPPQAQPDSSNLNNPKDPSTNSLYVTQENLHQQIEAIKASLSAEIDTKTTSLANSIKQSTQDFEKRLLHRDREISDRFKGMLAIVDDNQRRAEIKADERALEAKKLSDSILLALARLTPRPEPPIEPPRAVQPTVSSCHGAVE